MRQFVVDFSSRGLGTWLSGAISYNKLWETQINI